MERTDRAGFQEPLGCLRLIGAKVERVLYWSAVSSGNRLSAKRSAPILDRLSEHIEGMATEYAR